MRTWFAAALLLNMFLGQAFAGPLGAAGFVFSAESGNFRLLSVSGTGEKHNPVVIVEEYFGPGTAILAVRGKPRDSTTPKDIVPVPPRIVLSVIKIVINRSARTWHLFNLELREESSRPSTYHDGLSFDQVAHFRQPPSSDRFEHAESFVEPADRMLFHAGRVKPNETVRMNFFITDPTPTGLFYLLQQPERVAADLTGPSLASSSPQIATTP